MKEKTLAALLMAATLGSATCSRGTVESKIVREFTGLDNERVIETLYWPTGYESMKSCQVNITYPNGVEVQAVDGYSDGIIDTVVVVSNPHNVLIVREGIPGQEMMQLSDAVLKKYFSSGDYRGVK